MAQTTITGERSSESWLVVAAACIGTFVVAYNSTAILTALPAIKSSLDMDAEGLQWVMNVYLLASAVLVAVMGRFADIFGKMRMFLIGLGLGSAFALLPRVGLRGLPDKDAGQGSGVINTCLYLGCCVGTAAGGIVTTRIRHDAETTVIAKLHSGNSDPDELLAHGSASDVKQALARFSTEDAQKIKQTIKSVLDDSFAGVMDLLAVAALLGAILCFFLIRGAVPKTRA